MAAASGHSNYDRKDSDTNSEDDSQKKPKKSSKLSESSSDNEDEDDKHHRRRKRSTENRRDVSPDPKPKKDDRKRRYRSPSTSSETSSSSDSTEDDKRRDLSPEPEKPKEKSPEPEKTKEKSPEPEKPKYRIPKPKSKKDGKKRRRSPSSSSSTSSTDEEGEFEDFVKAYVKKQNKKKVSSKDKKRHEAVEAEDRNVKAELPKAQKEKVKHDRDESSEGELFIIEKDVNIESGQDTDHEVEVELAQIPPVEKRKKTLSKDLRGILARKNEAQAVSLKKLKDKLDATMAQKEAIAGPSTIRKLEKIVIDHEKLQKGLNEFMMKRKDQKPDDDNRISVFTKSPDTIRNAAEIIFAGKCPNPMKPVPLKTVRDANLMADQATSEEEVSPCFYWNMLTCDKPYPMHKTRNRWVAHFCSDCYHILRQRNMHQRTRVGCPFRKIYNDSYNDNSALKMPNF